MLNEDRAGARRYQDEVPAVARAVRLLERLARDGRARSLAELARELGVGPSSLLAILSTLRRAGLVGRDATGRYQLGPGLAALGAAASCKLRACERFAAIADELVAALGESVLLWVRQEDAFVLAAAREGTRPLRFVPTPGLRRPATDTALRLLDARTLLVEEELLPGVWTVGVALPAGPAERACIALAGPRDRLAAPSCRAALLALASEASDAPAAARAPLAASEQGLEGTPTGLKEALEASFAPEIGTDGGLAWERAGPIGPDELDELLRQSHVATLSYLADDGYPATVPLWYAWDGGAFWIASRPGSRWVEHIRLDPRVSLAVSESTPPLRRVLARGRLVEVDDPAGARRADVEAQLAARYAGFDAAREPAAAGRGRLLKLAPERLIAWRGLLRHPKLPPGPERPGASSWRHLG
jgi:DNA-binding IclR family transcriptional regulator